MNKSVLYATKFQYFIKYCKQKNSISISHGFKIEIITDLTDVDFFDGTFNLKNNANCSPKKRNGNCVYIYISSAIYQSSSNNSLELQYSEILQVKIFSIM